MGIGEDLFGVGKLRQLQGLGPGGQGDGGQLRFLGGGGLVFVFGQEKDHPLAGVRGRGEVILRHCPEAGDQPDAQACFLPNLPPVLK